MGMAGSLWWDWGLKDAYDLSMSFSSQIATKALSKGDKWGIRKVRELQLRIRQELRKGTPLDPLEGQPNNLQSIWEDALRVISLE